MNAALEFANKYNIPKDAVNEFLSLNADWAKGDAEAAGPSFEDTIETWTEETKNLEKIGGPNFEKTQATINRLLAENTEGYAEDFDQMLDMTGVGAHPLMIRFLHGIAEKLNVGEGSPALSSGPTGQPADRAKQMFPNMN